MQPLTALDLPDSVLAPSVARGFLTEHRGGLVDDALADALVLVSELATNAVVHGAAPIRLVLLVDRDVVRVEVHDAGDGTPVAADGPTSPERRGGRGLTIVAALSRAWGVLPAAAGVGKVTWFEIDTGRVVL